MLAIEIIIFVCEVIMVMTCLIGVYMTLPWSIICIAIVLWLRHRLKSEDK